MRNLLFDVPAHRAGFLFLRGRALVKNSALFGGLLGFAVTAVVLLSACSTTVDPQSSVKLVDSEQANESEPGDFPRTEEDELGRNVTIAEAPQMCNRK